MRPPDIHLRRLKDIPYNNGFVPQARVLIEGKEATLQMRVNTVGGWQVSPAIQGFALWNEDEMTLLDEEYV